MLCYFLKRVFPDKYWTLDMNRNKWCLIFLHLYTSLFLWSYKNFKNTYDKDSNKYEDSSTWIAETYLSYQPGEKTNISFNLARSLKGSPDSVSSSFIDTVFGINLAHTFVEKLSMNLGYEWINNDYSIRIIIIQRDCVWIISNNWKSPINFPIWFVLIVNKQWRINYWHVNRGSDHKTIFN